jgi:hypothetical protein
LINRRRKNYLWDLTMATERQIAANRRNALHSKGPRSIGGKKRASRNSIRHGFNSTRTVPDAELIRAGETLARKFFGARIFPENAFNSAQAEFTLARVRQLKVILIEGLSALLEPDPSQPVESLPSFTVYLTMFKKDKMLDPEFAAFDPTAPAAAPNSWEAAALWCLLELNNLSRYEERTAAHRDRCLRAILRNPSCYLSSKYQKKPKQTQFVQGTPTA